jgi:hypothetical protein
VRSRLIVAELLSDRVDVVLFAGGRRVAGRRVPLEQELPSDDWAMRLTDVAPRLRQAVESMDVAGTPAVVLYRSPTQSVDLASLAMRPGEALEAARLGCLDALPFSSELAICEVVGVGRDAAADPPRQHVVVAADHEDVAAGISRLVEDAGLRFEAAVPISAALMGGIVRSMLGRGEGIKGQLYVGEHTAFFVLVDGGDVLFARHVNIGVDTVARAMTRPIHMGPGLDPVQLGTDAARRIVYEHGRPAPNDIVHAELGLVGSQVVPLMQPVLQRLVIELRQSLRFGLNDEQREKLVIELTGPGANIPGLDEVIGRELHVQVKSQTDGDHDWVTPGSDGSELVDALEQRRLMTRLNIQPRALARRRHTARLRRWFWTGAAAAVAVIAVDAARSRLRLADVRDEAEAISAQIAGRQALEATSTRLTSLLGAMNVVEGAIDEQLRGEPNYRAILHELSLITPETVRLSSISLTLQAEGTVGSLGGFAFHDAARPGRTALEPFIDRLRASPLFGEIVLSNVQTGVLADRPGEQFAVSFRGLLTPTEPAAVAGVTGEDRP